MMELRYGFTQVCRKIYRLEHLIPNRERPMLGPWQHAKFSSSVWLLASAWSVCVLAQVQTQPAIFFTRFGREEGVSHYTVRDIIQDRHGLIWLATHGGLDRFDGSRFVHYRFDPLGPGLRENRLSCLLEDQDGNLWIGTDGQGLSGLLHQRTDWVHAMPDPEKPGHRANRIQTMALSSIQGIIWVGTLSGVFCYERDSGQFVSSVVDQLGDLNGVFSLVEERGYLWIGHSAGLSRLALSTAEVQFWDLGTVRSIHVSRDVLWIGSATKGLLSLPEPWSESLDQTDAHARPEVTRIHDIGEDRFGNLWVGTSHGLVAITSGGQLQRFVHDPLNAGSLSYNNVNAVAVDAAGGVWAGTWGGGVSLIDSRIDRFSQLTDLKPGLEVMGIHGDRSGRIWIGTWGESLKVIDPRRSSIRVLTHASQGDRVLEAKTVIAMLEDRSGKLWFGTRGAGLARYVEESERLESTLFAEDPFARVNLVHTIYEHDPDTLFLGTSAGGFVEFKPGSGEYRVFDHREGRAGGLSDPDVWAIEAAEEGRLWLATSTGLNRFDPATQRFDSFQNQPSDPSSLPHNRLNCLYRDLSGRLWVGTEGGGLALMEDSPGDPVFEVIGLQAGMNSLVVQSLVQDQQDLWIATDVGLSRMDLASRHMVHFHKEDGTQPRGYMSNSVARINGQIWFGGFDGVTVVHADRAAISLPASLASLTEINVSDQVLLVDPSSGLGVNDGTAELILRFDQHPLSIGFFIPEYVHRVHHRFQYRMDGLDQGWVDVRPQRRVASYSKLAPDEYAFNLRGALDQNETMHEVAIRVIVLPPWWMTWWARGLIVLLVVMAISLVHGYRLSRIRASNRELELKIERRTEELANANQQLLEASRTDYLTGLPNRRGFADLTEREFAVAKRSEEPMTVAIVDLDHFKRINDLFGHDVGDRVLVEVAIRLRDALRDRDLVARWGGEEFVVLMPETNLEGAIVVANRMLERLQSPEVAVQSHVIQVTATVGLAEVKLAEGLDRALLEADSALYSGKTGGRNRVVHNAELS